MTRFISISILGLLLSELAIFLLSFIRRFSGSVSTSDVDPLGGIAIFTFLGFSITAFMSLIIIVLAVFKQKAINYNFILLILTVLLWTPAVIALLSI